MDKASISLSVSKANTLHRHLNLNVRPEGESHIMAPSEVPSHLECMLLCNVENKRKYLEYLVFNAKEFMKLKGNMPQRRKGGSRKS